MELQNKFEEIIKQSNFSNFKENIDLAKECTKLCLEEQISILFKAGANFKYIEELQQQLKDLKNE
jgi:pantothenate kinase